MSSRRSAEGASVGIRYPVLVAGSNHVTVDPDTHSLRSFLRDDRELGSLRSFLRDDVDG
jgi:hypothetical protein